MAVVAGIDEAGYGPLMGPLVVSAVVFRVPDGADLWRLVSGGSLVRVLDSKRLYRGRNGFGALEGNLLPFLELLEDPPRSVEAWVDRLAGRGAAPLSAYPWYRNLDRGLPRVVSRDEVRRGAKAVGQRMASAGVGLCGARVEILAVREFNREVRRCGNKAAALGRLAADLMGWLWGRFGEEGVSILVPAAPASSTCTVPDFRGDGDRAPVGLPGALGPAADAGLLRGGG